MGSYFSYPTPIKLTYTPQDKSCEKCKKNMEIVENYGTKMACDMYDELGKTHNHDPNLYTVKYFCQTCGDTSEEKGYNDCWCGWSKFTNP